MRAAIYARVSTADQSCEMQLINLRDYISSRGWDNAGEYVDTGWSGARASRPQLDKLMRDAYERRFDVVLVWKLDRWGRSVADCVRSIQELAALGVRFVAITQNIDTDESNPAARLLLHIFAAFAEFERELIRERVVTGIRAAQGRGTRLGRPRRVFRRDQALRLRSEGRSWREIAAMLGVPFSTVIDACRAE